MDENKPDLEIVPAETNQPVATAPKTNMLTKLTSKRGLMIAGGFGGAVVLIIVVIAILTGGDKSKNDYKPAAQKHAATNQPAQEGENLGDPNATDPRIKGLALSGGQCSGSGAVKLTHSPMDIKDVETIQPMGAMIGGHVTPIDHEYYYQKNQSAPKDTYPVYATADGAIVAAGDVKDGQKEAWNLVISHSCTFFTWYNLMTSITSDLRSKLPAGWGPNSNGGVKIPVKSGQLLGYVGGQSLDIGIWNTEKHLTGLLNPIAYNNSEPWKIVTVPALDYFTDAVKAEVLQRYIRTAEPRDGRIDYDVQGEAAGTWFLTGSNGYAGFTNSDGKGAAYATHLALAYDSLDPAALTFSIGDYQGQPMQFAVKGSVDWTKITKSSGLAKVELAQRQWVTGTGVPWHGQYATGIKLTAGPSQATALIQMVDDNTIKVEVFPSKLPSQVSSFTSAAKTYDRGQGAHMIQSTSAH